MPVIGVGTGRERSYESLVAWQKAMDLVDAVYAATRCWPRDELFGLVVQVRRAVVSVPAIVAEGQGRTGAREFLHHLSIACGSLCEVETLLRIAHRQRYLDDPALQPLLERAAEVSRLLKGLIRSLR